MTCIVTKINKKSEREREREKISKIEWVRERNKKKECLKNINIMLIVLFNFHTLLL